jgi:hypothetical protein
MQARGSHRLARTHALLDRPHDRLQDRRADAIGAGAAEAELDLAVAQDDGWRHHRGHPPPRRDRVEAERVEVLLAEHVVEDHAGARHQDAGAGTVGAGDVGAHSVAVEGGDVGGRAEQVAGGAVENGPVEQARLQLGSVEGLGEGLAAGRVGGSHRRDQLLGAAALAEALEQAQAVGDQDPARGGRWVGQHLGAAEAGPDRLPLDRLVGREVRLAQSAAVLDRVVAQRRCDLATAEGLGALGSEAFERLGQLAEAEDIALAQGAAGRGVKLPRPLQPGVDRREDVEDVGLLGVDRRALPGELDRWLDQLGQRHRAEALQRLLEAGGGSGNPAGSRTYVERLHGLGIEVDRYRNKLGTALDPVATRRRDEEVEQHRLAAVVDHHEAARAEAGQRALDREGGEHRGNRGVDGVSTLAQHLRSRLGGEWMAGSDNPTHATGPG